MSCSSREPVAMSLPVGCVALSHTKRWSDPGAVTFFRKEKSENLMTTVVLLCLQTIWKMRTGYKYLTNENWKESSG